MLSYQHAYHAGNAADVHKHALLCLALDYLTRKDKPLTYLESHAGRGLYDLRGPEATKTGEAQAGILRLLDRLATDHPYRRVLADMRRDAGPDIYPGSPVIAARMLRPGDHLHLAELHPAEHAALRAALPPHPGLRVARRDGLEMLNAMLPPTPRRGLALIDPSWEVAGDYDRLTRLIPKLAAKWNVGVIALWYPILRDGRHGPMIRTLRDRLPEALVHEVRFPPARDGHGMIGSGMFIVNPPWGLVQEAARVAAIFEEG